MPIGINNVTNITLKNITDMINVTDPMEFFINVNNDIYSGMLYFIILWALWVILFFAAQDFKKQILVNLMYSGAIISVISFFLRAIVIVQNGVIRGLLTDYQMWLFPIITALIACIVYATKDL